MTNAQFEEIYQTYFQGVYHYILRLSGKDDLAREITSDTFFKAMCSIDKFRGECDLSGWLCRIARNCFYSRMRQSNRIILTDELPVTALLSAPDTADLVQNRLEVKRALAVLETLEEPYQEVFSLRVFGELDFREIGSAFGKSQNWACVTYHRARKKILEKLGE